ncbi:hypothetical protein P7F88_11110 [Vibrio hannami]|nr:hypothetical protein [Vibrio hannami]MDG3086629.1 hypothetical protein [Vibrio hannami]
MDIFLAILPAIFWGSIVLFNVKLGGGPHSAWNDDRRFNFQSVSILSFNLNYPPKFLRLVSFPVYFGRLAKPIS